MDPAREHAESFRFVETVEETCLNPRAMQLCPARHLEERWTDEDLEGDERRHRIARQAEDGNGAALGAELAEGERASRTDRDRPEVHLTHRVHDRLHVVVIAHRNAAAGYDE